MFSHNPILSNDYLDFKCSVYFGTFKFLNIIENNQIEFNVLKTHKYSPHSNYTDLIICQLLDKKYLKLNSNYKNYKIAEPFLEASFKVNTSINIENILNRNISDENIIQLWKEIGSWECMEYLIYHFDELKLPYEVSNSYIELYFELLDKFSIGQLYNVTYKSIESSLYQLRKGQLKDYNVYNYVHEMIKTKAKKSINEGFSYHNYERNSKCSQSKISNYFFSKLLNIDEESFKNIPFGAKNQKRSFSI